MQPAIAPWFDSVYLSADTALDAGDQLIQRVERKDDVAGGAMYSETLTVPLPAANEVGYHVIVVVDSRGLVPDSERGNPEAALAAADVKIDEVYETPLEHHNPMEPHATVAAWDEDGLTLFNATQAVHHPRVVEGDVSQPAGCIPDDHSVRVPEGAEYVRPLTERSYRDPVPGFAGEWLAALAPVGKTGFVVLVQTPRPKGALWP